MSTGILDGVKSWMSFDGWTDGGSPGSVKLDVRGSVIAKHGDATCCILTDCDPKEGEQTACIALKGYHDKTINAVLAALAADGKPSALQEQVT